MIIIQLFLRQVGFFSVSDISFNFIEAFFNCNEYNTVGDVELAKTTGRATRY